MSWFSEYLTQTDSRSLTKWQHYFDAYEREFTRLRTRPIRFLEIGVYRGGSIPMWRNFFAEGSTLVFVDIDPACAALADPGTHVEIGNQADPEFMRGLAAKYGPFDVVVDDGSHVCAHQIASFEALWPHMAQDGLYMVEDCHSSYWPGFGGGYQNYASFIEFAKRKIDAMHSWYTDQEGMFRFDPIAKELAGVRFYDSIVVMEKAARPNGPVEVFGKDGQVSYSQRTLKIRGRRSIFAGRDGS